jgi:hypothetical protein
MLVVLNYFNLPVALVGAAFSSRADAYRHPVHRRSAASENATAGRQRHECKRDPQSGHRAHPLTTHTSQIPKKHDPASIKHYRSKIATVT